MLFLESDLLSFTNTHMCIRNRLGMLTKEAFLHKQAEVQTARGKRKALVSPVLPM